jgi:hypothetical protein
MSATTDRRLTNVPLRVGVWFLALVTLAVGVTATLAPRVFTTMCRGLPSPRRTPST